METLPPLSSLLAFEAVIRTGSLTAAAGELGRTHGAVSKQLHQLQEHAGVALFRKKGVRLVPTAEGKAFARVVSQALEDLRAGYTALRGQGDDLAVTIGVGATVARAWLIPALARFNADWPEIDVLIRLLGPSRSRGADPMPDLVLSWDRLFSGRQDDASTVPLGDVHIGPVVAPSHLHYLSGKSLVCDTRIDRAGAEIVWKSWSELTGIAVRCRRATVYDHSYLAFEAAKMGMGMVMAPRFLIKEELENGTFTAPAGFIEFRDGFYIRPAAEKRGKLSRNARILLDWMAENARLPA